jgi:hypothetical protein
MRYRIANRRRRAGASLAGVLALALAISVGPGMAWAEDEEDVPLDTKLMRQLMKDLGLLRDGESIEYRERAPLVVPPSRNLPPPVSEGAAISNPAWPNDPDVQERKRRADAKRNQPRRTAAEAMEAEARPLLRSELDRGRVPAGRGQASNTPEEGARPMKPSELGSKGLLGGMFSGWGNKTETETFTGEPVRESLTAPPPGYQTPSPNHPYGVGPWTPERAKPARIEDRVTGETR